MQQLSRLKLCFRTLLPFYQCNYFLIVLILIFNYWLSRFTTTTGTTRSGLFIQSENSDLILDSIQSEIVEWMNSKSRSSSFQFSFTHMIDIRTLQLVVDAQEQVVRLVGTIPDGCTKI
ncbi:Hypothetical_protein [Hexamita inflata]|uniref:Hypothetical_protein n=1 Tax=Hexamita inflata TaxID=28002 RepID=A0AA86TUS9_9EUKA|nr:Hypothetical protein HINF_LOCUS17144 [Hexamita inflata]CAI9931313.1 Hypothetical protein HINF_LOCUS18958 [Hexamita inflata]